ncbi:MAG: hypothetical protein II311_02410 [Lachnospiraceae bacterium]|nr:hypothetical protein [Lachnospiraceae bacterium]
MLNEEKVVLMTKLAAYEQHRGKKDTKIRRYFRGDFLLMQMLKTVICATIAYAIMVGLYMLYHLEEFMEDLYQIDFLELLRQIVTSYGVLVVFSCVFTYIVYSYRYRKARKSQKEFMNNLKKLNAG